MINLEDWAEARRLQGRTDGHQGHRRRLCVARNTVREARTSDVPPRYERAQGGSAVDAFEPPIFELLKEFPRMREDKADC